MFYLLNPCQSKAEFSKQGLVFICTVGIFKTDNQYKLYLAYVGIILRAFGEMLHDVFWYVIWRFENVSFSKFQYRIWKVTVDNSKSNGKFY